MAKRRDYRLSEAELKVFEEVISKNQRSGQRDRCFMVRLWNFGYLAEDVAEMKMISKSTVYTFSYL